MICESANKFAHGATQLVLRKSIALLMTALPVSIMLQWKVKVLGGHDAQVDQSHVVNVKWSQTVTQTLPYIQQKSCPLMVKTALLCSRLPRPARCCISSHWAV